MCGVPVERADEYLHRLIALGHRVAVCEQLEDPAEAKKRGPKSVVRRDVVRLVTPGTLTEDTLLDARRNNYLLAVARARASGDGDDARFALAWIDISTGEFRITECDHASLFAEVARLEPGEVIVSDALFADSDLAPYWRSLPAVMPLTRDVFDGATAERRLTAFFSVATSEAFGALTRLELTAAAACVTYVERTQTRQPPAAVAAGTRNGRRQHGHRPGDARQSRTDAHAVWRAARLAVGHHRPHRHRRRLAAARTKTFGAAHRSGGHRPPARRGGAASSPTSPRAPTPVQRLAAAPDLARALPRLVVGRGGPRDLAAIRDGLSCRSRTAARLGRAQGNASGDRRGRARRCAAPTPRLPPSSPPRSPTNCRAFKRDGGFVREGYDAASTRRAGCATNRAAWSPALQARYAETTGIRGLKIRHNNVLGYFVEVTAQHGDKLMPPPLNTTFIHRQTLPARCASPPPSSASWRRKSPAPPSARSASSSRSSSGWRRR